MTRILLVFLVGLGASTIARAQVGPATPIQEPVHVSEAGGAGAGDGAAGTGGDLEATLKDLAAPIRVLILLSFMIFLPAILLTLTSYTRVIIVLSFVRRAIGAQELPPNPILMGLALFITGAIMAPTLGRVHAAAVKPWQEEQVSLFDAVGRAGDELQTFMLKHTREDDLALAFELANEPPPRSKEDVPFFVTVPAFVLSELRTAFRMGFIIFLPFLLIDLVVAAVLLSLGMFMLPPTMIAMPLKILLFVLVDGWSLMVQSLTLSYASA